MNGITHSLRKHLLIFGIQLKNNWVREAIYRSNFLTSGLIDLIWIVVEGSLFTAIYTHVPVLAGWTKPQVFFFLGVFFASDALFTTFCSRNFWQFPDLVNRGDLDILLTKPASPIFLAMTRTMNLTTLFNIVLGFGVMIHYGPAAGFAGGAKWLLVFVWITVGFFTQALLRFAFSVWIFWTDRGFSLSMLYYKLFTLATKPDALYPTALRYVILTALPFGFIGSVPARALLQGLKPWEYVSVATVLIGFTTLNSVLWNKGLKRYQSASS